MEYRQRDWLEWLVTVEFAVNNKVYSATKVLPVIAQGCGQTLGLGLEQSKDMVVVFY